MTPEFRFLVAGEDCSAMIGDRLLSMQISNEDGSKADRVEMYLDNRDGRIAFPPVDAGLQVSLGFRGFGLSVMGSYAVEGASGRGPARAMTTTATAADLQGDIRAPRTRAWTDQTLSDIVATIASKAKLKAVIDESLRGVPRSRNGAGRYRRCGSGHPRTSPCGKACVAAAPPPPQGRSSGHHKAAPGALFEEKACRSLLPGNGAVLAPFASHTLEKKLSKRPQDFGKGAIEAVAGPESANNAGAQTSFIPLLTLGVPPNAVMAIMIGAMMIQGIVPGPQVMTESPTLFWGMIAGMWIGNLMLLVINVPLVGM